MNAKKGITAFAVMAGAALLGVVLAWNAGLFSADADAAAAEIAAVREEAARRAEHQQLTQGGISVEEAETLHLDATRTKYKRWKEPSESLREALALNEERRKHREGRKNPEARQRRAQRRSSGDGADSSTDG